MKKFLLAGSIFCLILGQNTRSFAADPTSPTQSEKCPQRIPQLTILELGAEPKQELRFTPVVGAKQTLKIKIAVGTNTSEDQQNLSNNHSLTTEIIVNTTVKKIDSNGDIHLSYLYSGITASETNRDISSTLSKYIGFSATTMITPQGNVKKTYDYIFPKNVSPEMKQIMMNESLNYFNQFYPSLPSQAVGVGAKWKINQYIPMMYILSDANQTIIYELIGQQDNVLNFKMTVEPKIYTQEYKRSTNHSDLVQITTTTTQGEGNLTIDLSQMLPINSTALVESKTIMKTLSSEIKEARLNHYNWFLNITIKP